jgi:predicted amidophosphoribosyltransferase
MCPVCRARFRGSSECSRCGADLKVVMSLQARAWQLREAARQAIADGDPAKAGELASQSEALHHTPAGRRLTALSSWLADH